MKTEYEVRVLEIDKESLEKKLFDLGATKIGDWKQKRYVYDMIPKQEGKWLRLRTNGEETTLTFKNVTGDKIDSTKEAEIIVSDLETTNEILNKMGYYSKAYQENNRVRYILDNVELDIDTWPMIPTYLEIEGKDEESVDKMIDKLGFDKAKVTALDVESIYEKIYSINLKDKKDLRF